MGTLRLLLAVAVLLSHADFRIDGRNPGVTAVIGFYLISGYVMAGLVRRHYPNPGRAPMFYLDRLMRLYPQYLVYGLAALVWFLATGTHTLFLARQPNAEDLWNNLLVAPLNLYMFNGSDAFTLIPPAWSLGAELQFYLLAPFMLLWPRLGIALALGSLWVHIQALHGSLQTDWYGYRLLAGVLWVFGLGMLMYHWHRTRPRWAAGLAMAAPLIAAAVYHYLKARGLHLAPYHQEVLWGWGIGVPLLHWLGQLRPTGFDVWAGDVSYGVFLNHFLLIWLLYPQPPYGPLEWGVLVTCSVLLSWASQHVIERPVLALRRRLRANGHRLL